MGSKLVKRPSKQRCVVQIEGEETLTSHVVSFPFFREAAAGDQGGVPRWAAGQVLKLRAKKAAAIMGSAGGEVSHWNADVNGISLHVAEQGPADGPAVVLLHGFPELWL
uniref:AB hydrolase-1 domain-containing protein n=1 Tax=Leersia perrieri TaxID=77586 RepID=A0A0D9Y1T3_9ORYZ